MRVNSYVGENFTQTFRVYDVKVNEKYTECTLNEGRKLRDDDANDANFKKVSGKEYKNTNRRFVRFVGHAHNKIKELGDGVSIYNLDMSCNIEPYISKEGEIAYPDRETYIVYSFEVYENNYVNMDKAPKVADESVNVEPVKTEVAPVAPVNNYPF